MLMKEHKDCDSRSRHQEKTPSKATHNKSLSPQVKIYNRNFYLRESQRLTVADQYQKEIRKLANMPKIMPNSYLILAQKVESAIDASIRNKVGEITSESTANFSHMQAIIREFLSIPKPGSIQEEDLHCQLWILVCGYKIEREVSVKVLSSLFRILLDPYHLSTSQIRKLIEGVPTLDDLDAKRQAFLSENEQVADQTPTVGQTLALWNKFRKNSTISNGYEKSKEVPELPQRKHRTYHPKVGQRSRRLAEKDLEKFLTNNRARLNLNSKQKHEPERRTSPDQLQRYLRIVDDPDKVPSFQQQENKRKNITHHEILYKRPLEKDLIPKIPCHSEKSGSTTPRTSRAAKPEQISAIVNNLYFVKQRKEDLDYSSIKEQQELKRCSFRPSINRSSSTRSISPLVNGYDQTIQRLKKGREQQERKKKALENMGRVKKFANAMKAPSFLERDTPKLILEVKIDTDWVEKINLKGDEDPHIVAKKFVLKHNLSDQMLSVLQDLVQQQLSCL